MIFVVLVEHMNYAAFFPQRVAARWFCKQPSCFVMLVTRIENGTVANMTFFFFRIHSHRTLTMRLVFSTLVDFAHL